MTLLTPLGLLGLIGIIILIIIYIIKPNYQQKFVSTTFVWKLSLKYRKRKLPFSKLRNIILIICQVLLLTACAAILTSPNQILKSRITEPEVIVILDSSASMRAYNEEGLTRYERATEDISELVAATFNEDGFVSVIVVAWRRILGLGIYILGRNLSYDGYDRVGATIYLVIPLYLLYETIYRPSCARCGLVVVNAGIGSDVALLLVAIAAFRAIENNLNKTQILG